eukprot:COSAG02_NODE_4566_length_5212_cov_3.031293_3_plen_103_part_00
MAQAEVRSQNLIQSGKCQDCQGGKFLQSVNLTAQAREKIDSGRDKNDARTFTSHYGTTYSQLNFVAQYGTINIAARSTPWRLGPLVGGHSHLQSGASQMPLL